MKFLLTLLVLTVSLSVSYGQFGDVLTSCAKERGITDEQMQAIGNGDFSSVTNFYGCYMDCACKKLGVITGDTFNVEAYEKQVRNLVVDASAKEIMEKCSPLAGTGECKISGDVLKCTLPIAFSTFTAKL